MNRFKKFSIYYITFIIVISAMIILFNWIVNPYNIYKSLPLEQLSQKPLVTSHLRLAKAMAVEWKKPEYLILGSSTAETGFNPQFPAWNNVQVYNLGLSGANIYEVMRYLQHAESVRPIKKVVLAVNFFMFNSYVSNRDDFDESILRVDVNGVKNPLAVNNFFTTLLSYDAIRASIETINNQNKKNAFQSNGQLIHNYREDQVNQLKGYRNNFINAESYNRSSLLPPPHQIFAFSNQEQQINTMDYMQKIITICEQNNTELTLVIAPEHVRLMETYKQLGLLSIYEQWQEQLVHLVTAHNQKYPTLPIDLWNFNKINEITTEILPEKEDQVTVMRWFWDPHHFKNELGNLILVQILKRQNMFNIKNFATVLTKMNVHKEIEWNRKLLSQWEQKNDYAVKEIRENLQPTTKIN